MPYEPEGYYVIKGRFTWVQLDSILGRSACGIQRDTKALIPEESESCGLSFSPSGLTYQVYTTWREPIGLIVAHVVLHPNGICFSGALRVVQDWEFAKELFLKTVAHFEMYQHMDTEIHKKGGEDND